MSDTPSFGPQFTHRREIRSFVLRGGRMTEAQRQAWQNQWPQWGLPVEQGIIDPRQVFGREAPLNLEIGFGMGQSLAEMAANAPEQDFIGIEVHRPGVGSLLRMIAEQGLTNIRIYCTDANEVIDLCLPEAILDRVMLFFPDPWQKKRHHKRRIVQHDFAQRIRHKLRVGGIFHLATDWENYAGHMLEIMEQAEGMGNDVDGGAYAPRPEDRPITKFERRGERLGHGVWDLLYRRTN